MMQEQADLVRGRRSKRRRGVVLSEAGRQRIHEAQRRYENEQIGGSRLSLERLSYDVGLSTKTISRVLAREMPVDLRTLELLFASLGITLGAADYTRVRVDDATQAPAGRRTAFFGRNDLLDRLRVLLIEKRIVTLVGSGGVGKTRLATEFAARFGAELFDRTTYCDLSLVTERSLVAAAVARAFGARPEKGAADLTIAKIVDGHRVLLLLDNCEHVLARVAEVADGLLHAVPRLVVLATSREPIGLEGEVVLRVPPLALPERGPMTVVQALAHPAIALFVDRAHEVDDGFAFDAAAVPATLEIVCRVEAVPLAIELAASRVSTTALSEIAQSLRDHMGGLATDSTVYDARHRSVRALVDWSYALLDDDERTVFRAAAVFMGSFDVAAVEFVCDGGLRRNVANVVGRLARKSLLFVEQGVAPTRFRMLETMRQDAALRLRECGEAAPTRLRHALYYNDLLAAACAASARTGQRPQFALIAAELDNVREALEWSTNQSKNVHIAASICSNMHAFWDIQGDFVEGEMWLRRVLSCDTDLCPWATLAQLHEGLGLMLYRQGLLDAAMAEAKTALELFMRDNDARGMIRAQNLLGIAALDAGEAETARNAFERNLREAQALGDDSQTSVALNNLGRVLAEFDGETEAALDYFARSLALARSIGKSTMIVLSLANLSEASAILGRYSEAIEFARRGMDEARVIENRAMYGKLAMQAAIYGLRLDGFRASDAIAAGIAAVRDHPHRSDLGSVLIAFAEALADAGQAQRAALLTGAIAIFYDRTGSGKRAEVKRLAALDLRIRKTLEAELYRALHLRGMTYALDEALEEATRSE